MSPAGKPLVEAEGLRKHFASSGAGRLGWPRRREAAVRAVDGVDLCVREGETVGLVGESGSGKSTLGRILLRLIEPDAGRVRFDGVELTSLEPAALRRMRRHFQPIFQDPYGSLNPRMRVGAAIGEPLVVHGLVAGKGERGERVAELLRQVGLDPGAATKYPHEFSGGQRQRIGIARAIACNPRFIVADEPVTALDPPVQAQIVNLLLELQERLSLSYLFVAHDLRLVERICDRVAVMYLGRIVEEAPAARLFADPRHPYTRALIAATPATQPGQPPRPALAGEPPSPSAPPSGCHFHPRCPIAEPRCATLEPVLEEIDDGHRAACLLARSVSNQRN